MGGKEKVVWSVKRRVVGSREELVGQERGGWVKRRLAGSRED